MPPTQCILSGGIRSATKLSSSVASTRVPIPWGTQGTKGTQGTQGTQGRLRRPWGGRWAHGDLWSSKPFRLESHFESRVIKKEHHSEMKAVA